VRPCRRGFQKSIAFSGLTEPTTVRFAPDGRVFVAEKSGLIKVFANLSATTPTVFHDLRTNVHNFWDRGLMGLELHPNFPTIPMSMSRTPMTKIPRTPKCHGGERPTLPLILAPPSRRNHKWMCREWPAVHGLKQCPAAMSRPGPNRSWLRDGGQQFPSHTIDTVMFGPDGALYVSAGDGAGFNFADYGQRGVPLNPFRRPAGRHWRRADSAHGGRGRNQGSEPSQGQRASSLKWHHHPGGSVYWCGLRQ